MRANRPLLASVLIVSALLGARPSATECVTSLEEPLVCGALKTADAVFLADVEDVQFRPDTARTDVSFRVVEAFKGVRVGVQTLRLVPAIGSYSFRTGQRVLVYASAHDGAWTTVCSRTRGVDGVSGELETLRALVKGVPGGLVDGHVVSADGANNYPGVRVTLRSAPGRVVQTVTTTGAGHFAFDWLSPGAYTLVVEGGPSFLNEQRSLVVRGKRACVTIPTVVLRRRT